MRPSLVLAGLAIAVFVLAACSRSSDGQPAALQPIAVPTPLPTTSTPTVSATQAEPTAAPPATPTPPADATAAPTAEANPDETLFDSAPLRYRYQGELITSAVAAIPTEEFPILAVAGHSWVQILPSPDVEPIARRPADAFGEFAFPSALSHIDGDFIVAIADTSDAAALMPPLMRWHGDSLDWRPVTPTITRNAMSRKAVLRTQAATSPPMLSTSTALTPPSPPWQGASGITGMARHEDTLWATGWATVDGMVTAAVWSTGNGTDWFMDTLPPIGSGIEYGSALYVNDTGITVSVGTGSHFGAGLLHRSFDEPWQLLPFPPSADHRTRIAPVAHDQVWLLEEAFAGDATAHSSFDLERWTAVDLPTVPSDDGFWQLGPGPQQRPIAWRTTWDWSDPSSTARLLAPGGAEPDAVRLDGHYVGTASGLAILQDLDAFIVVRVAR